MKDTKKSTIAKRVGQITPMCDPKTTRAYCCTKPNWISRFDTCRLWNNRPRPHSLGLLANIFAARKKNRRKIFSREDFFARRYFRENISNSLFAKISSRENKVLYRQRRIQGGVQVSMDPPSPPKEGSRTPTQKKKKNE